MANRSSSNPIIGVIGLVLFLIVAYFLIKSIAWVLGLIAPVLLILTFFIDRSVIIDYGKWIMNLFKTKWYFGLGAGAMTFFGFPFVSAFLFGKAMFKKKVAGMGLGGSTERSSNDTFTDYEEVESEISYEEVELPEQDLDLPEIEENFNTLDEDNAYDNLFGNDK